jgi:hypothetical protein
MSGVGYEPLISGFSRVFIIEDRARPDHEPDFQACLKGGSPSQTFGDVERLECPDPERYGAFIEVASIVGATERGTIALSGRYARDLASELLRIAKKKCANDVQIHLGACSDPSDFNVFEKNLILEDARLTNWSTADDIGALGSDENAKVDEQTDISFGEMYEVLPLTFAERAGDVVFRLVIDVVICDKASCGDCEESSDGCQKIYAVTQSAPGSPGLAPDVVYSLDKGVTWANDDINSMLAAEEADALACLDVYVVVVSEDSESLHYKEQADIDAGVVGGWLENGNGIVAGNGPMDIWSWAGKYAFIAAENGYVYGTSDPTADTVVLDAGVATNNDLFAVHAISDLFAVAVGEAGTVIYTVDQVTWAATVAVPTADDLLCVWIKNQNEWWVGDDAGHVWYTLDQGQNWTEKDLPGVGWTQINDISFPTDSIGYISAEIGADGQMLRSYDGGFSWVVLPEWVGDLPDADSYDAHAACTDDPNFVVAVGLGDNALDGIIIVGND